jgi:hypothetical protein
MIIEPGTSIAKEKTIYELGIEGRGGNSVHSQYYETEEGAILASAVNGENRMPRPMTVLELSDGSLVTMTFLRINKPPSVAEQAKILEALTPAQRILTRTNGR